MQKPTSFTSLPKSKLFSKLDAFLPVLAAENKKLSDAVAAGEGAKHNIELEEKEGQVGEDGVMTGSDEEKKQQDGGEVSVIEMNFALGVINEDEVDAENTDEVSETRIRAKAALDFEADVMHQHDEVSSFRFRLKKPSNKPRAVIQELSGRKTSDVRPQIHNGRLSNADVASIKN